MLTYNIRRVISDMFLSFRNAMPRIGEEVTNPMRLNPEIAFCVSLEIYANNYGYRTVDNQRVYAPELERSSWQALHFMITTNYSVYFAPMVFGAQPRIEDWCNLSNHDSAWTSSIDRMINEAILVAKSRCESHMPKEEGYVAEVDFRFKEKAGSIFSFAEIQWERIENDSHYRKLVEISPLDFSYQLSAVAN